MAEAGKLAGKKVVVTGASRGIGRAIALACAREGAVVGINSRAAGEEAQAVQREIGERFGRAALLLPFDVRSPDAVAAGVARFRAEQGRIDGWVNNAGINLPDLLVAATPERMREQVEVNVLGPLFCARAVIPEMMAERGGVIVNVGSVAAARPVRGQAVYAATKGALESLTRALAVEYGRKGIRVHCLRPGPISTAMIETTQALAGEELLARVPLRRLGRPEEVAEMTVFLLSDAAAFVTGSVHTIDGGYLAG